MLVPLSRFVVFTVAPALFLVWSTSPKLCTLILPSIYLAVENPSHLLHLLNNLPGKSRNLFFTGETMVCSLICDNMEFSLPTEEPMGHLYKDSHMLSPVEYVILPPLDSMLPTPEVLPRRTSWLVLGMLLMGLNVYIPQLSPVGSFWSPVQAAIQVMHWMTSWKGFSPEWELSLVSLYPLSHMYLTIHRGLSMSHLMT
ncbi:hypothetical protein DSO57_1019644 [Entomophthora muscae]|uniref:Uncharacterized protein n=1 Tax=Entomophthora muscae TaxID=34485 RepID=A0ACC2UEA1_9FUNG|nr:hypothetical protein DSO57_1019644 [Entomophthora muscae]